MPKISSPSRAQKRDKGNIQEVHVAIENPQDIRRAILESAKGSVSILKREKRLDDLRSLKLDSVKELDQLFQEILSINSKLEKIMPTVKLPSNSAQKAIEKELVEEETEKPVQSITKVTRLDEFEQELEDIERRLDSLRQ